MGSITAAERASETRDAGARFVAQVSSLGSLADDVVGDLIRVEARVMDPSKSKSLVSAGELLSELAIGRERPIEVWTAIGAQETFRQLYTFRSDVVPSNNLDDGASTELLQTLSRYMERLLGGDASPEQMRSLKAFFSHLASATMGAAQTSMLGRGTASSWLTR